MSSQALTLPPCPQGCRESRYVLELPVSADTLYAFHERDDVLALLAPAFPPMRVLERTPGVDGPLGTGARVVFELRPLPFVHLEWIAEHVDHAPGRGFVDVQQQGPFAHWRHTHLIEPTPGGARLTDIVQWRPRPSWLAPVLFPIVEGRLKALFAHRHAATRRALVP
jgi:ligand-binding SRPBCC domain-containing protein